jgi:hypothetical protein
MYFSTLTAEFGFLAATDRKSIKHDPKFQEFLSEIRNR